MYEAIGLPHNNKKEKRKALNTSNTAQPICIKFHQDDRTVPDHPRNVTDDL